MSSKKSSWTYLDTPLEKNYLWSLAVTLLPVVSSFAVSWIIARWGGPEVMGTIAWTMALATVVLIIGKFGLGLAASRLASEYGVEKPGMLRPLFKTGLAFRFAITLVMALLTLLLAGRIAGFFNNPGLEKPVQVAALLIVGASLYEFMEHFIVGLNRIHVVYKVRTVNHLLRLIFTSVFIWSGWGAVEILTGYSGAWLAAIVVYLLLLLMFLPSTGTMVDRRELVRRLLVLGVPLAASSASVTIFSQTDRLMIGYFFEMDEVGQYAIARNVTEVSLFPAFAMVMTLRPALASRFSAGRVEECSRILQQTFLFALVFGVLFASVLAVFAVPLFTLVYSTDFLYAGELMAVFIWVIVLRSVGAILLPSLIAAEKTKFYAWLTGAAAGLNVVLNLILIPSYRSWGAVIATILSYTILLIFGFRQVARIFNLRFRLIEFSLVARTFLAGLIAGGVLWPIMRMFGEGEAGFSLPLIIILVVLHLFVFTALIHLFRVAKVGRMVGVVSKLGKTNG